MNNKGFTLIELSIVMVIFSLVMLSAAALYKNYDRQEKIEKTYTSLNDSKAAILDFISASGGRYPCPARLDLAPGDVGFGVEDCGGANMIVVQSIDQDLRRNDADNDGAVDRVFIGMVPIVTLTQRINFTSVSNNTVADGWGNKLVYAVSENVTRIPFNREHGSIMVTDENGITLSDRLELQAGDPPGGGAFVFGRNLPHMVLVSAGEDQFGSYSLYGTTQKDDCTPLVIQDEDDSDGDGDTDEFRPEVPGQKENCDENDAIFMIGIKKKGGREALYDDNVTYHISQDASIWRISGTENDPKINAINTDVGRGGYLGVGVDTPQEILHIDGSARLFDNDGNETGMKGLKADAIRADLICDNVDGMCMEAELVGGNVADMQCPEGEVIYAVSEGKVRCQPVDFSNAQNERCPDGQFLNGVSSITGLICIDP